MNTKKPWRKVLYEKQPYPDNYTDKKIFLMDLRKNIGIQEVKFFKAFAGSILILQEFCTIVGFTIIYVFMVNEWVESSNILNYSSIITICGFFYYLMCFSCSIQQKLGSDLRTVLTYVVFGQLLSPILHTLTDTISTDTIYTTTFFMMVIHLVFFDYGVSTAIVSHCLSLSAAIFASICLASRLSSAHEAFILMTVATEVFVLFPMFKNKFNRPFIISSIIIFCNCYCLYHISHLMLISFLAVSFFVSFICSVLFVQYQNYKENIYGPWDEAVVDDADCIIHEKNK